MMQLYAELTFQFILNLVAIYLLAYQLYYRRHGNRSTLTLYLTFNLFLFPFLHIDFTIGSEFAFTLFAVLAMMRIRSTSFTKHEMAYFFGVLALSIINATGMNNLFLLVASNAIILLSAYIADHPKILPVMPTHQMRVLMNHVDPAVVTDAEQLKYELAYQLNAIIVAVDVKKIDLASGQVEVVVEYRSGQQTAVTLREELELNEVDDD